MDFQQRLAKAIERGQNVSEAKARARAEQEMTEEDFRRLHSQFRLPLTEHIESCLRQLPDHFPGFRFSTVMDELGWGAAVSRDDVGRNDAPSGGRANYFSRLEVVVRPFSNLRVLEVAAKGTIRNKEVFNRSHYQRLTEADSETFADMIDLWVLEYAELFAAS